MSSIAQNLDGERQNRWLLIGAAVLALVTGVLLFVALANFGSGDDDTSTGPAAFAGDVDVLVATQNIDPNTKITAEMFEKKSYAADGVVDGAISDPALVVDKVTRSAILRGEQISTTRIGAVEGVAEPGFRDTIPAGRRAASVSVNETSSVAGLLVPGDRVDVIAIYTDDNAGQGEEDVTRVETILQNIEVLAFAQETLEALPSLNADGTPIETDASEGTLGQRRDDLDPNESASTATLSLTPEEVQIVVAAAANGELTLALRAPADDATPGITDRRLTGLGYVLP